MSGPEDDTTVKSDLKPGEVYIIPGGSPVAFFPERIHIKVIRPAAQFDADGECLHINKCWYSMPMATKAFCHMRCCSDCHRLIDKQSGKTLSKEVFEAILRVSDLTDKDRNVMREAFREENGVPF